MTAVILEMPRREEAPEPGPRAPFAARVARWLWHVFQAERERHVLWIPLFIGLGITLYFALPAEPPPIVGLVIAMLLCVCAVAMPQSRRALVLVPLVAICLGFVAGQIRTLIVAAPVLQREIYASVTGTVRWIEPLADGRVRLLLDVREIDGLQPRETPKRVRVSLRGSSNPPAIGDVVMLKAALEPPSGPVAPGAYDFARIAWFAGVGANGYGGADLKVIAPGARAQMGAARWFAALRAKIETRIDKVLPQREAGIATALIVGARGGIAREDTIAMQNAGVSHVLSISGLHLALIAGLLFFSLRGALALVEPIALRWPVKKIAAVAALAGTAFYVGISDGAAPVLRSFIMFALVILAVLIDRPAISLRTVAFAACVLLLAAPESLIDPSFQMSFAAVIALIAAYEWYGARRGKQAPKLPWLVRSVLATAATSLIAESATAPFAAYHFNQFQIYGFIANEVVVPLLGFFIMPMGALAVLAMPFGLEEWPLKAMGWGIDQMLAVAHWTADLPGAVTHLAAMPGAALVLTALGGLWLCLWRRPWRLAGLAIAALGVSIAVLTPSPDAFIGEEGDKLAFRVRTNGEWRYGLLGVRPDGYRGEIWLKRLGADPEKPLEGSGLVRCDALGCTVPIGRGQKINLVRDGRAIEEECASTNGLISLQRVRIPCPAPRLILDWPELRQGPVALRFDGDRPRIQKATQTRRPWQRMKSTQKAED